MSTNGVRRVLLTGAIPLVVAGASLLVLSCGPDNARSGVASTAVAAAGPVFTAAPSDAIESALIEGPLILSGGCLLVDASEGGPAIIVFASGTTWDASAAAVINPDGSSVAVGQVMSASGGGHPAADLPQFVTGAELPNAQRCIEESGYNRFVAVGVVGISGG